MKWVNALSEGMPPRELKFEERICFIGRAYCELDDTKYRCPNSQDNHGLFVVLRYMKVSRFFDYDKYEPMNFKDAEILDYKFNCCALASTPDGIAKIRKIMPHDRIKDFIDDSDFEINIDAVDKWVIIPTLPFIHEDL